MLKVMNTDAADIRIPRRLYVQPQKRRQLPIRKILTAATGISGFVLAMAVERSLWFTLPALGLLAAALVLQTKR